MKHLLIFILLLGISVSVYALDLNPPPWRGEPRSTLQVWEFNDNNPNPMPDLYQGPFNPQPAEVIPVGNDEWLPELNGFTGIWPLSGEVWIPIYNFPEPLDIKRIWIQVTWADKGTTPLTVEASGDGGPWISGNLISEGMLNDFWNHSTYEILLQPNPPQELVHIFGSVYVDEIVIDTICIPEPMTILLLGLGGCLLRSLKK